MFQQWEKGREKTTFPIVFNYDYNRQKFANLDKADKKILLLPPSTPPLPPPLPPPPPPPERRIPPKELSTTVSSHDRKLRKRKSRSLERRRQPKTIELSDSDEDITAHPAQQSPSKIENIDEVDNCATITKQRLTGVVVTVENVPIEQIEQSEPITEDNGAPSGSSGSGSAATVIGNPSVDRNQLRIDELSASTTSGNESHSQQHVIVDVHEPVVVLEIREDSDDGPLRSSSFQTKLTKDKDLADVPEHEAENDNANVRQPQKTELTVTTSPAPLPTTITATPTDSMPIVLVQKCDINENVVETDLNTNNNHSSNDNHSSVIEVDINHNDVSPHIDTNANAVKIIDCNVDQNDSILLVKFDHRRMSESSRSSFDESDGMDTEPTYARVESLLNTVSVVNYRN